MIKPFVKIKDDGTYDITKMSEITFAGMKEMVLKTTSIAPMPLMDYQHKFTGDWDDKSLEKATKKLKKTVDKMVTDGYADDAYSHEGVVIKPTSHYYTPKYDGSSVKVGKELVKAMVSPAPAPVVFRPVLKNPRSAWGKRMQEKLQKVS